MTTFDDVLKAQGRFNETNLRLESLILRYTHSGDPELCMQIDAASVERDNANNHLNKIRTAYARGK